MPRVYQCPFWAWEERERICCEGGSLRFHSKRAKNDYADHCCANLEGWEGCTVAQNLLRYYEQQDAEQSK